MMATSGFRRKLTGEGPSVEPADESLVFMDRKRQKTSQKHRLGAEATHVRNQDIVDGIIYGLCSTCQRIFSEWSLITQVANESTLNHPSIEYHKSVQEMIRWARMGCNICAMALFDAPEPWDIDCEIDADQTINPKVEESGIGPSPDHANNAEEVDLTIFHWGPIFNISYWNLRFTIQQRYSSSVVLYETRKPVLSQSKIFSRMHPPWSESLKLVNKWLRVCSRHHVDCFPSKNNAELPTRLLAINNEQVNVVLTTGLPSDTKYATLSHCWGKGDVVKLTRESSRSFGTSIPQDRLCNTFRDAIMIASSLGLAYLWIDSLCIMQDDQQEWRHESVRMSQIYCNSYLNIAAAGAKDGSEGCFFEREKHRFGRFDVGTGDIHRIPNYYTCIPQVDLYSACVTETPLASRAWTLQERLLCPRNLYFSRIQLLWECHESVKCESFPDELPTDVSDISDRISRPWMSHSWERIIAMYTKTQMTREEDKLVAISGIIRKIAEETGNTCIAGLWRHNMVSELLWYCLEPGRKPTTYRAPSWSWAAVDGEISFDEGDEECEPCARVLEAHVIPKGEDPLGELCGGGLQIVCRSLFQINIEPAGRWSSTTLLNVVLEHQWRQVLSIEVFWDFTVSNDQMYNDDFYLLPLRCLGEKVRRFAYDVSGLVLKRTGEKRGQYSRQGIFRHIQTEQDYESKIFEPTAKLKEEEFCDYIGDDRHRDKHWVINII